MDKDNAGPATQRQMLSIQATPDTDSIRTAQLHGQEHTVIPAIALVEGVLHPANAPSPELALAEEFGRFPDGWNGRPVVYDHPRADGMAVSASSPDVLEVNSFGQLFNTKVEDGKLKTEIWINNDRVKTLSEEAQAVVKGLSDGTGVAEVSTGLFTMSEQVKGVFNGQEYDAIWRNCVPDHLAILPEGIKGACSVEDGAGAPRTNSAKSVMRVAQLWVEPIIEAPEHLVSEEDVNVFKKVLNMAASAVGMSTTGTLITIGASDSTNADEGGDDINSNIQENAMNVQELVSGLIANEGTQFTEEDQEWLLSLNEDQLTKLAPVVASTDDTDDEDDDTAGVVETNDVDAAADGAPVSTDDYIAGAPAEVQAVLNSGLRMHRAKKAELVKGLLANSRCKFTEAQLQGKEIEELENITALAQDVSYEGLGTVLTTNQDSDAPPAAPLIFEPPSADAA